MNPARGHSALRKGRVSIPGARYFLTCVTESRKEGLLPLFPDLVEILSGLDSEKAGTPLCMVGMPDHIHFLLRLKAMPMSEVLRKFKGRSSVTLRACSLHWQKGAFHDHRLRESEELLPFLQYMLLNPYVAGLCPFEEKWEAWWCHPEVGSWFLPLTDEGRPLREWSGAVEGISETIGLVDG